MAKQNLNTIKTLMAMRWEDGYTRHLKRYLKELKKLGYTPTSLKKMKDGMERSRINCLAQHNAKQSKVVKIGVGRGS